MTVWKQVPWVKILGAILATFFFASLTKQATVSKYNPMTASSCSCESKNNQTGTENDNNDTRHEDPFRFHGFNTTFFVETAYSTYLNHRQACAVESAGRAHTPYDVVVYMSGVDFTQIEEKNPWIKFYDNVKIIRLYPDVLFRNTEIEKTFFSKEMQFGPYRVSHTSDFSRIHLLKKYGGLYMDLDFIVMRSFLHFGEVLTRESSKSFVPGLLRVKADGMFINEVYKTLKDQKYNPKSWGGVGPALITSVAERVCGISPSDTNLDQPNKCNLTIKKNEFFPVEYPEWSEVFAKDIEIEKFRPIILNESYAVHFNSHLTKDILVRKNGSSLLNQLAKKHCPEAYKLFPAMF